MFVVNLITRTKEKYRKGGVIFFMELCIVVLETKVENEWPYE